MQQDFQADWAPWLASAPGRYMLAWQQQQLDALVEDVFGFYAVQCGLPQLDGLRASRIACRVLISPEGSESATAGVQSLVARPMELPLASQTVDLLILPHGLDQSPDPHALLREADRVLRPEGRLVLTGFNPISLWGARQALSGRVIQQFLPAHPQAIVAPRLRDWLKLLSFEPARTRYGCFRPPCRSARWLDRTAFFERAGDRWWPICGALWAVSAVKRVHGMRLVGLRRTPAAVAAPAAVARIGCHPAANEPLETPRETARKSR